METNGISETELDEAERVRRRAYTLRSHELNRTGIGEGVGQYVLEAAV